MARCAVERIRSRPLERSSKEGATLQAEQNRYVRRHHRAFLILWIWSFQDLYLRSFRKLRQSCLHGTHVASQFTCHCTCCNTGWLPDRPAHLIYFGTCHSMWPRTLWLYFVVDCVLAALGTTVLQIHRSWTDIQRSVIMKCL